MLMIFISLVVLVCSTLTEAKSQRKTIMFRVTEKNSSIEVFARMHELEFMKSSTKLSMIEFQNETGGDINAIAMIFDENVQLLATEMAGNNKRRIDRLQTQLTQAVKSDDDFWRFITSSGSNSIFHIEYYDTYRRESDYFFSDGYGATIYSEKTDDESGQFHVFAAEAFPLLIAMRKLLPIYILVVLLLISLLTVRKMVTVNREHTEE
jgi:hypothetical protein